MGALSTINFQGTVRFDQVSIREDRTLYENIYFEMSFHSIRHLALANHICGHEVVQVFRAGFY